MMRTAAEQVSEASAARFASWVVLGVQDTRQAYQSALVVGMDAAKILADRRGGKLRAEKKKFREFRN